MFLRRNMKYIATTFAHGNGPYVRCVEWAIELNNVREQKRLSRLPIVVPLVYPGRQERIHKEEIASNVSPDFLARHPDEILFDRTYGELLAKLMFKGKDYAENLELLSQEYQAVEDDVQRHLNGKRQLETFDGRTFELDLRDAELQLGLNNRMQTGLPNQFYTAGGAGPFDEILERAMINQEIKIDKETIKRAIPIARKMILNQRIIMSNYPGVFSYDRTRPLRENEINTPPFIHFPKLDETELPGKGIYLMMTGIDGIRENGMYNAISELGMKIYAPSFSIESLPRKVKKKAITLNPNQINNPNIVAQYARAGWSSVWLSHLSGKGFITPQYNEKDDPEIFFNEKGIEKLGFGAIIRDDVKSALEKSLELAEKTEDFNKRLLSKYKTLDGIKYSAEKVADAMHY